MDLKRRGLTAFHSDLKLIFSLAASLEHVLGFCLWMLFWAFDLPRLDLQD